MDNTESKNQSVARLGCKSLISVILIAVALALQGCVTKPPGGNSFCLKNEVKYIDSVPVGKADFEYFTYDFGKIRGRRLYGSGMYCGLSEILPIVLKWQRVGGEPQSRLLDTQQLVVAMKKRQGKRLAKAAKDAWSKFIFSYDSGSISIDYVISSQILGTIDTNDNVYHLTTVVAN